MHGRINGFPMRLGLTKIKAESNLYYKVDNDGVMIFLMYVYDLFLRGEDKPIIECKKNIVAEFEMKDL